MAAVTAGAPLMHQTAYLASSVFCILSLAGLSSQSTARLGNALGMLGVSTGIIATLGALSIPTTVLAQIACVTAIGGGLGYYIANKVGPTELPQCVAAFHSFVGLAAVLTSIAQYLIEASHFAGDPSGVVHKTAIFLGTLIGGVTFTGSLVAFGKLQGLLDSKALLLPGRNFINVAMATANVATFGAFMYNDDPYIGLACLAVNSALSFTMVIFL